MQRFPPSHLAARQWTARASAGQHITPVKAAGRLLHFVSPLRVTGVMRCTQGRSPGDFTWVGKVETYCRPGLAAAARRLHRRGQAVRLWLLGCSHRCDRPGGGCCSHWRGQARRLMQPRWLSWKYLALFDIIHLISNRLAMPGVDTLISAGCCISAASPGGCCAAAASARPVRAASNSMPP